MNTPMVCRRMLDGTPEQSTYQVSIIGSLISQTIGTGDESGRDVVEEGAATPTLKPSLNQRLSRCEEMN